MMSSSPTSSSKVVLKRKKSSLCEIKVTLLGDRNVGKSGKSYVRRNDYYEQNEFINTNIFLTATVVRFLTRRYIMEYEHGIDNRYKHEMMIESDSIIFDIFDASSPATLCISSFDVTSHTSDLFLLMYSITDRQSFIYVKNLLKHLVQLKGLSYFV
jgi:Ras-like protein family protein 11A